MEAEILSQLYWIKWGLVVVIVLQVLGLLYAARCDGNIVRVSEQVQELHSEMILIGKWLDKGLFKGHRDPLP